MAKSLHAYCPRCRSYAPVDSFAGGTSYAVHDNRHAVSCANSGQPCYYIARDHFAGSRTSSATKERKLLLDVKCELQRLNMGAPVSRGHVDALIERLIAATAPPDTAPEGGASDELSVRMATVNQCTVALIDLMNGAVMSKFATQRECSTYRAAILEAMNAVAGVLTNAPQPQQEMPK